MRNPGEEDHPDQKRCLKKGLAALSALGIGTVSLKTGVGAAQNPVSGLGEF